MRVRLEPRGDAVVVTAGLRLVVGNRQSLKTAVLNELENGRRFVVIDLGETDLIDSGGLGVLVTLYRRAEELGGKLVLANLSQELGDLLRLTRLDTIFTVVASVEEALGGRRANKGPLRDQASTGASTA